MKNVLKENQDKLSQGMDVVVKEKTRQLDAMLVYKPKGLLSLFGSGNNIVKNLTKAAQTCPISPGNEQINPEYLKEKTTKIRDVLKTDYLNNVVKLAKEIPGSVWTNAISQMHDTESELLEVLQGTYRTLLEQSISGKVDDEFSSRRSDLEVRAKRFRTAIETLQEATATMNNASSSGDSSS